VLYQYNLVRDEKMLQRFIFFNENKYDTIFLPNAPVNTLLLNDLTFSDDEQDLIPEINIDAKEDPIVQDGALLYKFFFNYQACKDIFVIQKIGQQKEPETDSAKKITYFFTQLPKADLYINHAKFTGVLKLVYPCLGMSISMRSYIIYNLIVSTYKDGKLVNSYSAQDVGIISEQQRERPT
jgi:hypothetical protein